MGISRHTVRRLIAKDFPPQNHIVHPRPGGLSSPTLICLHKRDSIGAHDALDGTISFT